MLIGLKAGTPLISHKSWVTSDEVPIKTHKSWFTSHESQVMRYQSRLTSHDSQVTSHESQVMRYQSRLTSHESQVTSHKSQVTGHRSQIQFAISLLSGLVEMFQISKLLAMELSGTSGEHNTQKEPSADMLARSTVSFWHNYIIQIFRLYMYTRLSRCLSG